MDSDITVVLTLYKRPEYLQEQLEAIHAQTIEPKEIIILKNFVENINFPVMPSELLHNVVIVNSSKNFGVWGRFAIGLLANTKYVCFFDDDTIPGIRWLENCMESMNIREGLYGTIGLIFHDDNYEHNIRYGWDRCIDTIKQVDIVGHSWFLKREWLHFLWETTPNFNETLKYGEDISLSFNLQKHNIPTLVPPHPAGKYELFGSNPLLAYKYGCDANSTCGIPQIQKGFQKFLKECIKNGFKLLYTNTT